MQQWKDDENSWRPSPQQIKQITALVPVIIAAVFIAVALLTSVYTVAQDELGVVTRFGKFLHVTQPGLHFKLPLWIDAVRKPTVQRILKDEFGFRTKKAGVRTTYTEREYEEESLMLCGDRNCAMVEWIVQYKIKDPKAYLFNVREPRNTIRDVAESVMRNIVGDSPVDEVLTIRKIEISNEAQIMMQEMLDLYDMGIKIVTVKLQDVNPPKEVEPAFNEVNIAQQDRERFINEAWQNYNKEVPRAKGEALKMIEMAKAYAINRTNTAKGDAARFLSVWVEYSKAKDVTRRRIYLETMKEIMPHVGRKFIMDEAQTGVLPLLPLTQTPTGGKK